MELNYTAAWTWMQANMSFLASLAGSATSAYFSELKGFWNKIAAFAFGAMACYFLAPSLVEFMHLGPTLSGYLTGFFGLNICVAVQKAIRRFGDTIDLAALLREFLFRVFDYFDIFKKSVKNPEPPTEQEKE